MHITCRHSVVEQAVSDVELNVAGRDDGQCLAIGVGIPGGCSNDRSVGGACLGIGIGMFGW